MKKQTMFRVCKDKNNPYVMLNKEFLSDERLSWKAKGILAYLLSLPDEWKIYQNELINHATDGIDGLKAGIKELTNYGYISKGKIRNGKGQFIGWEYCVFEVPTESGKTDVGFSDVGKSAPSNNNSNNNNISNIYNQSVSHIYTILGEEEYGNIRQYFVDKLYIESLYSTYWERKNLIEEIVLNITEMYFKDSMVINDKRVSQNLIRAALMKLTQFHIEELIHKFIELSKTTKINNPKAYMQSMIYNIAFENDIAITNVVNFEIHNEGR